MNDSMTVEERIVAKFLEKLRKAIGFVLEGRSLSYEKD